MRIKKEDIYQNKITIELDGPTGNAFYILGVAQDLGRQLFDEQKVEEIMNEMKSGDYDNLMEVFESYFGQYVLIIE